ncbi:MAG TPA: methylmalonyl-CoA mutase family protein [Cyclobacteriaceae bacterium]|nr:methylmalonyl-CoA mutase family protein [Cyclobacteriaceae bacterium]
MSNKLSIKSLFSRFSPATKEDWIKIASAETQPRTVDQLTWKGANETEFAPYYDKKDHEKLAIRNNFHLAPDVRNFHGARSWLNLPPVLSTDESFANQKTMKNLENGADGVLIECGRNIDFKLLLNGIQLESCQVFYMFPDVSVSRSFVDYLQVRHSSPEKVYGGIFWKKIPSERESIFSDLAMAKNFFSMGVWIESQKDPAEEIVEALVKGVHLVDYLTDKKCDPEKIFSSISFSLESGTQFFFTLAKLKALRILWYQVIRAYGVDHPFDSIHLHMRCEALRDESGGPHTNMLKSSIAGLAATLGGCQSLSVYPQEPSNPMLERVARNISSVLREESHFNAVADPTIGSYFIDTIVNKLAENAWAKFKEKLV